MHRSRKEEAAIHIASGLRIKEAAELTGYTPEGLRNAVRNEDMQALIAKHRRRIDLNRKVYETRLAAVGMHALENWSEFVESEDDRIRMQASRDAINWLENRFKLQHQNQGQDSGTHVHLDAESTRILADAFKGAVETYQSNREIGEKVINGPHLMRGKDAVAQTRAQNLIEAEIVREDGQD